MRRPRRLSVEERALWEQVARSAEPLHPTTRPQMEGKHVQSPTAKKKTPHENPARSAQSPAQPEFRIGERGGVSHPGAVRRPPTHPIRMDARTHSRMRKGRVTPEARIDLHGMTLAQAHGALIGFILGSRAAGRRLVLVITGKGRPRDNGVIPSGRGLLREQVPDWLTLPPLADLVLDVSQAHASHGGAGALYVYLRKR